jgi:phage terminase large subunit
LSPIKTRIELPEKLRFLLNPARYKIAYGGRGGAKSWAFARALLLQGMQRPMRILCAREVQKSIKDSVHRLLSDQIETLGLNTFYEVLQTEIRGVNGTSFIFAGLSDQTAQSIKSFEGIDRCWVEEGQAVSRRSWDILTPTIRVPGSEIWVSMNPELDTDETYQRFVAVPPENAIVVKVNYEDNPWLTDELEAERQLCQQQRPDDYGNIWLGEPRAAVVGAIYAKEIGRAHDERRVRDVPPDPLIKAHAIFDLGFNDATAIVIVQRVASELRIVGYVEDRYRTLDDYSQQLRAMKLNWGQLYLPHDAQAKLLSAGGTSTEQIMRSLDWSVRIVPNMDVEDGIMRARMAFPRCYFDQTKAMRLIECLKRYRRNVPVTTGEPARPVHDEFSHGADAFRYMAIVADELQSRGNEPENTDRAYFQPGGWMS